MPAGELSVRTDEIGKSAAASIIIGVHYLAINGINRSSAASATGTTRRIRPQHRDRIANSVTRRSFDLSAPDSHLISLLSSPLPARSDLIVAANEHRLLSRSNSATSIRCGFVTAPPVCEERGIVISVFVCLSLCLSVREYISRTTRPLFTNIMHVISGRGSVLLWRRCNTCMLCK